MNNYLKFIILIIIIVFILIFIIKILHFIPKKYHNTIQLLSSFGLIFILSGTLYTFYKDKRDKEYKNNKDYSDNILAGFEKIDDYLINNYENSSIILDILYNRTRIPSSNTNMNSLLKKKLDKKQKDILFMIYSKLCFIFEKMYIIDKKLFENSNLGIRVRIYTENIFFYEYWNSSNIILNSNFVKFMEEKYKYLQISNKIFYKPDRIINRIPYMKDVNFIFESPKNDGLWY
jgi:hypothetical protein